MNCNLALVKIEKPLEEVKREYSLTSPETVGNMTNFFKNLDSKTCGEITECYLKTENCAFLHKDVNLQMENKSPWNIDFTVSILKG